MDILYIKYNRSRLPVFQTETLITQCADKRQVIKRALCGEGRSHIQSIFENSLILQDAWPGFRFPKATLEGSRVILDYVSGISWDEILGKLLNCDDSEAFREKAGSLSTLLRTSCKVRRSNFESDDAFRKVFARDLELRDTEILSIANIDLTFENLICGDDGSDWIIDCEWVFPFPLPFEFILARSVKRLLDRHLIPGRIPTAEHYSLFGINPSHIPLWEELEERFQDYVFGQDRSRQLFRFLQPVDRLASQSQQDALGKQLSEETAMRVRRDEEVALLKEHISKFESQLTSAVHQLTVRDQSILSLQKETEFLKDNISRLDGEILQAANELSMREQFLARKDGEIHSLQEEHRRCLSSLETISAQLDAIRSSRGWRMLQRYYFLRDTLLLRGKRT